MATLERAIQIVAKAHQGQKDNARQPYIPYPLRLMLQMGSDEARITAMLHDLL